MTPRVALARVATLDSSALAHCDFSFGPARRAYPFDNALERPREDRMIAVARIEGSAAGYIACRRNGDSAEVCRLEIDRACRRQGMAPRLLDEALAWAGEMGLSALRLDTLADNPAAARFFARHGFVPAGQDGAVLHWRLPIGG